MKDATPTSILMIDVILKCTMGIFLCCESRYDMFQLKLLNILGAKWVKNFFLGMWPLFSLNRWTDIISASTGNLVSS